MADVNAKFRYVTYNEFICDHVDPATMALFDGIGRNFGLALDKVLSENEYARWTERKGNDTFDNSKKILVKESYLQALATIGRAGSNAWVILNIIRVRRGLPAMQPISLDRGYL